MISNKQRTIALSTVAIAAVIVLFASGPLVATHQAQAWGGGWAAAAGGGWRRLWRRLWRAGRAAAVAAAVAAAGAGKTVHSTFFIYCRTTSLNKN